MKCHLHFKNLLSPIFTFLFLFFTQFIVAQSITINGVVRAPDGVAIDNVEVAPDVFTDSDGFYEFTVDGEFLITPQKPVENANCFGQSDLELFSEIFAFGNPGFYDFLIGDVNNTGSATTIDIATLSNVVVTGSLDQAIFVDWLFITQDYFDNNPEPTDASEVEFSFLVNDFSQTEITVDWVALLEGNLDGNYDCIPVATEDEFSQNITMFPNPVDDLLNINMDQSIEVDLAVYNLLGQQIHTQKSIIGSFQIDFSEFIPGTYLVELSTENQHHTYKIINK